MKRINNHKPTVWTRGQANLPKRPKGLTKILAHAFSVERIPPP